MFGHALGITDIWTYVFGVIFIILLPGPIRCTCCRSPRSAA